jgi:hypothetical protein
VTVRHRQALAAGVLATVAATGCVVGTQSASFAGGTGKAVLHLVGPDGKPVAHLTVCPTKKAAPHAGGKVGDCDTSDHSGHVTLRHVKAGKCFVTIYINRTPQGSFPTKLKVVAGKTTHHKYVVAG